MARNIYELKYAIELQSAFGTPVATLTKGIQDAAATGIDVSKSGVLLNGRPSIDPGLETIDTRKSTGSANRRAGAGAEYQEGHRDPSTSWETHAIARALFPFFETFFQGGRLATASSNVSVGATKWYAPHSYELGVVNASNGKVATIVQHMGGDGTKSNKVQDALVSSLGLTAEPGGNVTLSAEIMGGLHDEDYDASGDDYNYASISPLQYQNSIVFVGNGTNALEEADVPGFDFTMNNNAVAKHYNNQYVQKYALGDFEADGTLTLPWALTTTNFEDNVMLQRFLQGNVTRFVFSWGAASAAELDDLDTDNDLTIAITARYSGATITGDDEVENDLPFTLVEYPMFSEQAITSVTSGVVTPNFSGTETLEGNVYPGDQVVIDGLQYLIDDVDWAGGTFTVEDRTLSSGTQFTLYSQPVIIGMNDSHDNR